MTEPAVVVMTEPDESDIGVNLTNGPDVAKVDKVELFNKWLASWQEPPIPISPADTSNCFLVTFDYLSPVDGRKMSLAHECQTMRWAKHVCDDLRKISACSRIEIKRFVKVDSTVLALKLRVQP